MISGCARIADSGPFIMEDGAKEDPAQCKEPKFLGKAGWVKKAPGRLLASYKDRYVHVEWTEVVVYESEDLQNCLERLDLENYDKCHELKSPFKRKHRLILIRSAKSGNKVHDVKFQAQTAEEKEAWIKALSDGINRAKNKVFDEVKVDESSNLEHVTRTRPKGNRNRRPPTRIHMKEVADVSSDGILRLDLDLENALMPNGTSHASVDGAPTPPKESQKPPSDSAGEAAEKPSGQSDEKEEPDVAPQKKVIKPPMPPTKEAKPSATAEDEPDKDDGPVKKVLMPPMPPSKDVKPCASSAEEATEKPKAEVTSETSPDAKKKAAPPPTPPNKPSSSSSVSNLAEASQSAPPPPPSKEKKPSQQAVEPDQEVEAAADKSEEREDDADTDEAERSSSEEAPPGAKDDEAESPSEDGRVSEEESEKAPTEQLKKSPSPLAQPDTQHEEDQATTTHPTEEQDPVALLQTASDTSAGSPQADEAPPSSKAPSVVVSSNDSVADSPSLSPLLGQSQGEKKKKAEEKSVDSGQHSDDDSEGSGSEDMLAASTAALRGSAAGLDVLDASEDDIQISVNLEPPQVATKPRVRSEILPCKRSAPIPPLKPSAKVRSASSGDLLSDASAHVRPPAPSADVTKLEAEVALEMQTTSSLLSRVSQSQRGGGVADKPEDLLAKAMEKLQKADNVLREVQKLKPAKNSSCRKSW